MPGSKKISVRTLLAISLGCTALLPVLAKEDSITVRRVITTSQSKVESKKSPENKISQSTSTVKTRGVGFKNANVVEFKYKERVKNYKEQLKMGKEKGWLTDQEILEFREKISVLEQMEKKLSAKGYPKKETDKMEKMFTLYNQQFHKASTTPMSKKKKSVSKPEKKAANPNPNQNQKPKPKPSK